MGTRTDRRDMRFYVRAMVVRHLSAGRLSAVSEPGPGCPRWRVAFPGDGESYAMTTPQLFAACVALNAWEREPRPPARWLEDPKYVGVHIVDYDGWRDRAWETPISREEFERRLHACTVVELKDPVGTPG